MNIPKLMHVIWVGDPRKMPHDLIKTWQDKHPDWEHKIWGNKELYGREWVGQKIIDVYTKEKRWAGVADVMRYNILLEEGGFVHPADSECLHNIEPLLKGNEAVAVYENETMRPGLISPLYASIPNHPLVKEILDRLPEVPPRVKGRAISKAPWQVTGNLHMKSVIESKKWKGLKVLPSYRMTPIHHTGHTYNGKGKVYAVQQWGTTTGAGIGVGKYKWGK